MNRFGPVNEPITVDNFSYEAVNNGKCTASVCRKVCSSLVNAVEDRPNAKYLAICVPCYNECVEDLMKTFISLMQNVDFMQRTTKLYGDDPGQKLKQVFNDTIPIIVPIFDGTKALSPSLREWLSLNFKGSLDDMDGTSGPGKTDVRVACGKWWYYPDSSNTSNTVEPKRSRNMRTQTTPGKSAQIRVTRTSESRIVLTQTSVSNASGTGTSHSGSSAATHTTGEEQDLQLIMPAPQRSAPPSLQSHLHSILSPSRPGLSRSGGGSAGGSVGGSGGGALFSPRAHSTDEHNEEAQSPMIAPVFSFDDIYHSISASSDISQVTVQSTFSVDFDMSEMIFFHILPIIKRSNHRKHNSHEWFFNSVCQGLGNRASVVFLTDCGTTYHNACLARLYYELYFKKDLIGVTASQKVETPNEFFHPCEDSPFIFLKGDHKASGDPKPCWKCYATYICSPCPLQGFEFEATLIMNSAMFNLVEALPVMPGPCQLLDWQKMKKHKVVNAYFNLLFEDESDRSTLPRLPSHLTPMNLGANAQSVKDADRAKKDAAKKGKITLTEGLRVNMRLAEDRILSFVSVFCTGDGTKWIPDASFCYTPEILWSTLLTQRRRWLNGTFASFLFFFNSSRAKAMIWGGRFDPHKAGNSLRILNMLWSLQLYQLLLVLISPAIFGCASYIGLKDSARIWNAGFHWANDSAFYPGSGVTGAEVWLFVYFAIYAGWTIMSFYYAKMSEWVCQSLAVIGFTFVFPIYFALWYAIYSQGFNFVNGVVVATLLIPVVIASSQSLNSAALYCLYLPWFLFCILFFLVYLPSYSFARLWDTTWGNRAGASDSAITDNVQTAMKRNNFMFICGLILLNVFFTWGLVRLLVFGFTVVLGFMCIVFFPMLIQLVSSFIFLFIAVPLRKFVNRSDTMATDRGDGFDPNWTQQSSVYGPLDGTVSSTRSRSLPDHPYGFGGYEHKSSREGTVDGSVTRERLALHNKPPSSVRGRMHAMPTSTTAAGTSPNKPPARYTAFSATGGSVGSGGGGASASASATTSVGSARHPTMSPPLSAGSYGQLPSIDEDCFEDGNGEEEKSEYDGTSAVGGRRLGTKSHDIETGESARRYNDLKV